VFSASSRPIRQWARITIRVLMLLVVTVAVPLGWQVNRAHEQREAVEAVQRYGGWAHFDHEFVNGALIPGRTPRGPRWLRTLLGDEYFRKVRFVNLDFEGSTGKVVHNPNVDACDDLLKKISGLPGLKTLRMKKTQATDEGLRHIGKMSELEELYIRDSRSVTDAGVSHLAHLANLKHVDISFSNLTNDSLVLLSSLPRMEKLCLQGNHFSEDGLARLNGRDRLKELWIGGSGAVQITNAGLAHLRDFKKLEVLDLQRSRVTASGLDQLMELPNLRRLWVRGFGTSDADVRRILQARRTQNITR
jgi:Leucine rich repeat